MALLQQQDGGAAALSRGCGSETTASIRCRAIAAPVEIARDPLAAPLVELALVLGELARVAGVVQEAGGLELLDRVVDRLGRHALALQARAQLGDRELTTGDRLVGQVDRPLALGASPRAGSSALRGLCGLLLGIVASVPAASAASGSAPGSPSASGGGSTTLSGAGRIDAERLVDLALDLAQPPAGSRAGSP